MEFKSVFGPVSSDRLGVSLGLDLLGDRICSFDCLYCESGKTKLRTMERRPYLPGEAILEELGVWLEEHAVPLDHITLGGLGEPCLNRDLGSIVLGVKRMLPNVPLAVLTNSSLLGDPGVREELMACDVILPSLDTLVSEEFLRLNRPCEPWDPLQIAKELIRFKLDFQGRLFLEILLVQGINDSEKNLKLIRDFCGRLAPDRVDVMTMTRPGSHLQKGRVSDSLLRRWREILGAGERTEPAGRRTEVQSENDHHGLEIRILDSLHRRPQTLEQLAAGLGIGLEEISVRVESLVRQGRLNISQVDNQNFLQNI